MFLNLPDDSIPLQEMFERFFTEEATTARVRAAEPVGFDAVLWRDLVQLEAPFLRLSAEAGGGGMGLFDACLMMNEAGRPVLRRCRWPKQSWRCASWATWAGMSRVHGSKRCATARP